MDMFSLESQKTKIYWDGRDNINGRDGTVDWRVWNRICASADLEFCAINDNGVMAIKQSITGIPMPLSQRGGGGAWHGDTARTIIAALRCFRWEDETLVQATTPLDAMIAAFSKRLPGLKEDSLKEAMTLAVIALSENVSETMTDAMGYYKDRTREKRLSDGIRAATKS